MNKFVRRLLATALSVTALGAAAMAAAQTFPSKPIRIIGISPPGNSTDTLVRSLLPGMSAALGQPVTIEAMPGSTGMLAHRYVAKAPPDGHTLLATATTGVAIPIYFKDPGYDLLTDLTPLTSIAEVQLYLGANVKMPFSTFNEMVAYAKVNPGKLNHGTAGSGDVNVLSMESIRQKFGLQIVDVPYKASSLYLQAMVANEVQIAFGGAGFIGPQFAAKTVKPLAVSGQTRQAAYPDVPTFAELGLSVDGVDFILMGVANTPKPIIDKLHEAVVTTLKSPAISEQIKNLGFQVVGSTPDALGRRLKDMDERYRAIAKRIGIKPQ